MPRARSLRQRIALGVTAALVFALGGLFILLDLAVDGELYRRFDAGLASRANAIGAVLGAHLAGAPPIEQWMPEFRESGHTDFFQAWDAQGRVVARSGSAQHSDLPRPAIPAGEHFGYFDLLLPDGHRGRAVVRRYALPADDPRGALVLVVAEEREQIDALERRLHLMLLMAIGLAMALAALLAARGASVGLRPLYRLADRIASLRLVGARSRLDDGSLPPELEPVARRFDEMIDALLANLAREQRFAQDLAHELRTPVAELRAITETSLLVPDGVRQRQALEELSRLGAEMAQTVEALLALARHEAGLVVAQSEPFDLAELIRSVCRRLDPRRVERELTCLQDLPAEHWVTADASMSAQLAAIMISNAVEHAPRSSTLRVGLDVASTRLIVENAAPELTPSDLPQLGRRFFRAAGSGTDEGAPHAGLGLALARALAQAQGLSLNFALADHHLRVEAAGWCELDVRGT